MEESKIAEATDGALASLRELPSGKSICIGLDDRGELVCGEKLELVLAKLNVTEDGRRYSYSISEWTSTDYENLQELKEDLTGDLLVITRDR